jgi:galactokinase
VTRANERFARLFVIARRHAELYEYLSAQFADDTDVQIVLDRRLAERRRRALPAAAERRRVDRRSRPDVDEKLLTTSLAIVTAAEAAPPRSEARHWVETMQRGVASIRIALDERDRLRQECVSVNQENERLRADMDLSWKELADVDSAIARAIAIMTDLRSRLRGQADQPE